MFRSGLVWWRLKNIHFSNLTINCSGEMHLHNTSMPNSTQYGGGSHPTCTIGLFLTTNYGLLCFGPPYASRIPSWLWGLILSSLLWLFFHEIEEGAVTNRIEHRRATWGSELPRAKNSLRPNTFARPPPPTRSPHHAPAKAPSLFSPPIRAWGGGGGTLRIMRHYLPLGILLLLSNTI